MIDELTQEILSAGGENGQAFQNLENDLISFQEAFTLFLNDVVTPKILIDLNRAAQENQWARRSLRGFLEDLPSGKPNRFHAMRHINHYHVMNFCVFNFNYTSLLDNYLCLDRFQFDPHPHKSVDTNAGLSCGHGWNPSLYLLLEIHHPNGEQSIPRSMIFGTDLSEYDQTAGEKKMVKSFWARNDIRYRRYFDGAELFIIFGMALSKTDGWWMHNILLRLAEDKAELIIYFFEDGVTAEQVQDRFFDACAAYPDVDDLQKEKARKNIYVVLMHGKNETAFLGFEPKPAEEEV